MTKADIKKKISLLIIKYTKYLDEFSLNLNDEIIDFIDKLQSERPSVPTKEPDPIDKENFVRCIEDVYKEYAGFSINREDLQRKLRHIYDDTFLIPQINDMIKVAWREKTASYEPPNHSLEPHPLKWKRCVDGMPLKTEDSYYPYLVYPQQGDLRMYNYVGLRDLCLKDKITHYCKVDEY